MKRANGEGSIEILPNGKARVAIMATGKRVRRVFDTPELAERMRAALTRRNAEGA